MVDREMSKSYITVLPQDQKATLRDAILKIVDDDGGEKVWINESEGILEYPYRADVLISHKK